MFITMIFGFLVGLATSETIKFEKCKAQEFETPACSFSKTLEENKAK